MKNQVIAIVFAVCSVCAANNALAQDSTFDNGVLLAYEHSPKESSASDDIFAAIKALEEAETSLKAANVELDPLDAILEAATKQTPIPPDTVATRPPTTIQPPTTQKNIVITKKVEPSAQPPQVVITKLEQAAPPPTPIVAKKAEPAAQITPSPKTAPSPKTTPKPEPPTKVANNAPNTAQTKVAPDPAHAPHTLAMSYVSAIYRVNGVNLAVAAEKGRSQASIAQLHAYAANKNLLYESEIAAIGDLAFFHNTYDRNRDGRWNDWHSLVGIVESVDDDSTITILTYFNNDIQRIHLNLKYPNVHKSRKGKLLNSQLRKDEGAQIGMSSKLFAGFANLLGDKTSVTVIDNWKPGMIVK